MIQELEDSCHQENEAFGPGPRALALVCLVLWAASSSRISSQDTQEGAGRELDGVADQIAVREEILAVIQKDLRSADVSAQPIYSSNDFYRSVRRLLWTDGVTVISNERDPLTGEFIESKDAHTTSFAVTAVAARSAQEFYLGGVTPGGQDVIEKWVIRSQTGAYSGTRTPVATTPIGTPVLNSAVATTSVAGGTFQPPSQRTRPRVDKIEILRGQDFGGIISMTADPDGRYLLVRAAGHPSGNPGLHQVDLTADPFTSQQLFDPNSLSVLDYLGSINLMQHQSLGRVCFMGWGTELFGEYGSGNYATTLFDADNDGVFESSTITTYADDAAWAAAGFRGAVWLDDFINDFD